MHSVLIFSLIFAISLLSASVNGECCDSRLHLTFAIEDEFCGAVGGTGSPDLCSIIICANGEPSVGTFCGKGSCNVLGCNCDGGCLEGDWGKSFLNRNKDYTIAILETEWKSGLLRHLSFLKDIQLEFVPRIGFSLLNIG